MGYRTKKLMISKLEKLLRKSNFNLYLNKDADMKFKSKIEGSDILILPTNRIKDLHGKVNFNLVKGKLKDEHKKRFENAYNGVGNSLGENELITRNRLMLGVLDPLNNPERTSTGAYADEVFYFKVEELIYINSEFKDLLNYFEYEFINTNELTNILYEALNKEEVNLGWIPFYEEVADKFLEYKDNSKKLYELLVGLYDKLEIDKTDVLLDSTGKYYGDICPFTAMAIFNNSRINSEEYIRLCNYMKEEFNIESDVPEEEHFEMIAKTNNQHPAFINRKVRRNENCIDNLWEMFEVGILYSEDSNYEDKFIELYDTLQEQGLGWKTTIGLSWTRPNTYLPYESRITDKIEDIQKELGLEILIENRYRQKYFTGEEYSNLIEEIHNVIGKEELGYASVAELYADIIKAYINIDDKDISIEDELLGEYNNINHYTKEDFLEEVFISEEKYNTIESLLRRKKNLILQGPPGVGKTFMAKRFAYSMTEEKDDSKIQVVQFHQNYSYEDFIMGYRPDGDGFILRDGVFYNFCKQAGKEENQDEEYFFIIDEINRGNLSRIFGELMMLIEGDKRGQSITLAYKDEEFSVPKNLYLIGMMNTADRSLAMIDYALRRRFVFVDLEPAFDNDKFRQKLENQKLSDGMTNKIINKMDFINLKIADDMNLGKGFKLGHSYFCSYDGKYGEEAWYEEVIKYEIEPLLREYWFDDSEKVDNLVEELLGD